MRNEYNLMTLRDYCKEKDWPTLPQWHHWIYTKKAIAQKCVKKIGGRYMIDLSAFQDFIARATLDESNR